GRARRAARHARHRALSRAPARADDLLRSRESAARDPRRGVEPRRRADDRRARRDRGQRPRPRRPQRSARDLLRQRGSRSDRVRGISLAPGAHLVAGARVAIDVDFDVHEHTDSAYKFLVAIWPVDRATWKPTDPALSEKLARSDMRATADGLFATDRWQVGQHV